MLDVAFCMSDLSSMSPDLPMCCSAQLLSFSLGMPPAQKLA